MYIYKYIYMYIYKYKYKKHLFGPNDGCITIVRAWCVFSGGGFGVKWQWQGSRRFGLEPCCWSCRLGTFETL